MRSISCIWYILIGASALLMSSSLGAQEGASWLRTRVLPNALNPNISVIGDFVGAAGPRDDQRSNRFALREVEFGFQAAVDPYARADFFVSVHEGESPEIEEGYVTLLALPWGIQARGGKFLANFGRLNMVHSHEQAGVDVPLVLTSFLGEEGLNDTGAEVSRIFAPFGLFMEVSYAFLNGLGGEHGHGEEGGETVFVHARDENGNSIVDDSGTPVEIPVTVHDEEAPVKRSVRNFAHVSRVRLYKDITDAANLELGVSGASHEPELAEQRRMGAVDLTFRWRPHAEGLYKGFIWRSEGLYSHRRLPEETNLTGAVVSLARKVDRRGLYSYLELQTSRRWRWGVRGDYVEDPEAKNEVQTRADGTTFQAAKSITRAVSPVVTFTLNEFNRFRLQYTHTRLPNQETERRGFLQWTVILGPHGAHPF